MKNLMVTLVELHDLQKSTEGQSQASLQHSIDLGFMAAGQTQSSPQWIQKKTHLESTKKHLKDPQTLRNKILWSDEPQF